MASKPARNAGIVRAGEAGAELEVQLLSLTRADDAPSLIVVDDVYHRQPVAPGRIQLLQREPKRASPVTLNTDVSGCWSWSEIA